MKLMVLDGNSLVNRAFFGIKLLTTKDGRYTNAIYGFQNILLNLLAAHKPDAVAIAWDLRAPTFRHKAYDGYKATRHGMPEELAQQMPVLKELLTDLGFVQVSSEGWEADDILGTLAAACEAAGGTPLLATGARASLQLGAANPPVRLATNKGRVLTYAQIYEQGWGDFTTGNENNTIGFHICNLREKLYRANPDAPFYIRSVREVGYCLDVDEP